MKFLFCLLLPLTLFWGCSSSPQESAQKKGNHRTLSDMAGRTVPLSHEVNRISCVDVLAFQSLLLLGAADKIAEMRLTYAPWMYQVAPFLKTVPKVTGIHIEEMLNRGIDLVFTYNNPDELKKLAEVGIPAIVAQPVPPTWKNETVQEFIASQKEMIRLYARVLGTDTAETRAATWCAYYDAKIKRVTDQTKNIIPNHQKRVFMVRGPDVLSTHGRTGYMTWYGELAGADMIVNRAQNREAKTQISMEEILAFDPEFIFIGRQYSLDVVYQDSRLQNTTAVKKKQVYARPDGLFYWDGGTEAMLSMLFMAKTLYPDRFPDLNLVVELQAYYRTFYHYVLTEDEASKILSGQSPDGSRDNPYNN